MRRRADERFKEKLRALAAAFPLQLFYDGRIIEKIDRYVFVGQFVNAQLDPCDTVMLVRSIPKTVSVTSNVIFNAIGEQISSKTFQNIHAVTADTTALNIGKIRVNTRLEKYFNRNIDRDIAPLSACST